MEGKGIQKNCQELTFARTESIIDGERASMHMQVMITMVGFAAGGFARTSKIVFSAYVLLGLIFSSPAPRLTMVVKSVSAAAASVARRFVSRHGIGNCSNTSSTSSSRALVAGISASAAAAAIVHCNVHSTRAPLFAACRLEGESPSNGGNGGRRKPRPPPRFTRRLPRMAINSHTGRRSFSSSRILAADGSSQDLLAAAAAQSVQGGNINNNKKKDDCPICRKYSKGPCGQLFTEWMACTDANPGKDETTGEELHLTKCSALAEKLAECLGEHAEEYSGPLEYDDDDDDDGANGTDGDDQSSATIPIKDLADAWLELIAGLESSSSTNSREPFPAEFSPELEVRPSSGWGVGAFAPTDDRDEPLILAYLKDQTGTVLAAGSGEDLNESGGFLRFQLQKSTETVTACAIYGGQEDDPIYERSAMIPK